MRKLAIFLVSALAYGCSSDDTRTRYCNGAVDEVCDVAVTAGTVLHVESAQPRVVVWLDYRGCMGFAPDGGTCTKIPSFNIKISAPVVSQHCVNAGTCTTINGSCRAGPDPCMTDFGTPSATWKTVAGGAEPYSFDVDTSFLCRAQVGTKPCE